MIPHVPWGRRVLAVALLLITACAAAVGSTPVTGGALTTADSLLVGRILLAEDRRAVSDASFDEGERHGDARIRLIARRARARVADPQFAARDTIAPTREPRSYPEPPWRVRYRALSAARADCVAIRAAMADSAWPVRLHAADVVAPVCGADPALTATLRAWVDDLPADASRRASGGVSWHAASHALVALARLRPGEARELVRRHLTHAQWQVRAYAARAAQVLADTTALRTLSRDGDANVREAAVHGLATLTPGDVDTFVAALGDPAPQVVRAAAVALTGRTRGDVVQAANAAFERWVSRGSATERDVRIALLEAAGRPPSDDRPPATRHLLAPRAVALALGADVRLRVRMSPASGGGSFVVRLRGDAAPVMAARILELAREGYYDGLTWHRVEHDFVIQGGSPCANEYVGLPYFLRDELGVVPHRRGTVGMSTRGHDTGDAQWFVNLRDNLRLDGDYTVFAEVVEGIDVVDGILEGDVIERIEAT